MAHDDSICLMCYVVVVNLSFMQRFLVHQDEDKVGPTVEQVEPEVRAQPPQPQQEPRAIALGLKHASKSFMKRNHPVFGVLWIL